MGATLPGYDVAPATTCAPSAIGASRAASQAGAGWQSPSMNATVSPQVAHRA